MFALCRVTVLSLLILPLVSQGALAEEAGPDLQPPAVMDAPLEDEQAPSVTPEPNSALLAGLGGLALLFFALRRK